jgi:predicted component of type VI protein secretion system
MDAKTLEALEATIKDLIEAFEPILELAKAKADLPAQLGIIVAADKALEAAKGQVDE